MIHPVEFYQDRAVRERLVEYAGGENGDPRTMTAEYLVGFGEALLREGRSAAHLSVSSEDLDFLLARGLDVFRSNWDKRYTLGVLDFEYFNDDYPGEVYLRPERVFGLLEPVRQSARACFEKRGIPAYEIMTGQGYHFAFQVPCDGDADEALIEIGRVDDPVAGKYGFPKPPRKRKVSILHGRSFDGMGRVMEFLAHDILRTARPRTPIPVHTTDVGTGSRRVGHEAISIDLSMYGDPIFMRDLRMPFSTHQKHKVARDKVGSRIARETPVQVALPVGNLSLESRLGMRRHFRRAAEWAEACADTGGCRIPVATGVISSLVSEYRASRLAEFHAYFDSERHDDPSRWRETYDRTDLRALPPCIAVVLSDPNPRALQPTHIQAVTRVLLGKGWHPRHIAGLLRSKYERNWGWGEDWTKYDASMRADFYVRLFAGQISTGLDGGMDHNCVSHAEKGCCVRPHCGHDLSRVSPWA